jgi:hypothetical protein
MDKAWLGAVAVGLVGISTAIGACSSSSSGGGSNPFVGTWSCQNSLTLTFTMPAGVPPYSEMKTETTTLTATTGNGISASSQTDSGAPCVVTLTTSGGTATIDPGQKCTTSNGTTISYTSGTFTVSGSTLTGSFAFSATGNIATDGGSVAVAGNGTQSSTCTKTM